MKETLRLPNTNQKKLIYILSKKNEAIFIYFKVIMNLMIRKRNKSFFHWENNVILSIYLFNFKQQKNVFHFGKFSVIKNKKKVMLCTLEFKVMIMKDNFEEGSEKKGIH